MIDTNNQNNNNDTNIEQESNKFIDKVLLNQRTIKTPNLKNISDINNKNILIDKIEKNKNMLILTTNNFNKILTVSSSNSSIVKLPILSNSFRKIDESNEKKTFINNNEKVTIKEENEENKKNINKNEENNKNNSNELIDLNKIKLLRKKYYMRNVEYLQKISNKVSSMKLKKKYIINVDNAMERFEKLKKLYYIKNNMSFEEKKKSIPKIEIKNKIYYYKIEKGNNKQTILDCFKYRKNWEDSSLKNLKDNELNLIWVPLSKTINYELFSNENNEKMIMTNHFEHHSQISNKLKLFINLMEYCEKFNLELFSFVPLTILIEYESEKFLRQLNSFNFIFRNIEKYICDIKNIKSMKKKYKNYFYIINRNDCKLGIKTSFFIPNTHYNGHNLWLLKAVNLNRGRCIKIIDSTKACEDIIKNFYNGIFKNIKESENNNEEDTSTDYLKKVIFKFPKIKKSQFFTNNLARKIDYYSILNKLKEKEKNKKYQSNKIILQKYIEQPLLYDKRKFDIRIWVLITNNLELYVFKEGHLKATSINYDIESKNCYVHLTNYSVQKYNENFSKFEYGNEISFDQFEENLKSDYNLDIKVRDVIMNKIKNIIKITFNAVKDKINDNNKKGCFEIFGYDFMIDKDLNPFLIEVNTNPGLEISSPLISKLVPRMIDDAFRLTIDKIFGKNYTEDVFENGKFKSPFHVDGYSDEEILYEKIDINNNEKII